MFLVVDTETKVTRAVPNPECGPAHARCHPLDVLADEKLDLVVVSGIGTGALHRLHAAGLRVYHTPRATAGEALDAIARGVLPPVITGDAFSAAVGHGGGRRHRCHRRGRGGEGHGHGPRRFRGGRGA
jgi:predicted Fe-Mo cluster-binding NifX family protein